MFKRSPNVAGRTRLLGVAFWQKGDLSPARERPFTVGSPALSRRVPDSYLGFALLQLVTV
jgi:hypothetical protein